MENLSMLKLFNSVLKSGMTQSGSSSSASGSSSSASESGKSGFEDVFKSYLDKTGSQQKPTVVKADTSAQQTQDTAEAAAETAETVNDAETPEKVIENLNISEEAKTELKKLLAEADTQEEADAFVQQLLTMLQQAGMTVEQVEDVMTDMASSIISPAEGIPQAAPVVLESVLDSIVKIQDSLQEPKAQFVIPEKTEPQKLTVTDESAKNQQQTEKPAAVQQQTPQTKPVTEQQSAQTETAEAAEAEPEVKTTAQTTQTETAEADETVIDLASRRVEAKADTNQQNTGDFSAKTHMTEKVITTEIKIEKPQDIMKFAELVEIAKSQNASRINVQLNPLEMGKVNIELTEQSGKVTGKVTFESETARNYFANNMDSLKQQLADKGVAIENLEFLFKDFDHHEFAGWDNGQKKGGTSSGSGSSDGASTEDESAQEENDSVIYA
ncbi:flagellar hook-length control protein FliK [Seleniivibrio woodruffii]|uniref:flagellar hook-length control protein FliK n=1 Tax=Seleniivibrio woodruffii TaxID=1078050 RepID=UPI0026F271EB|nr:flagellar hook-length control protein FliK [Seleniivibrio woodruffii]